MRDPSIRFVTRALVYLFACIALAALLTGCGKQDDPKPPPSPPRISCTGPYASYSADGREAMSAESFAHCSQAMSAEPKQRPLPPSYSPPTFSGAITCCAK